MDNSETLATLDTQDIGQPLATLDTQDIGQTLVTLDTQDIGRRQTKQNKAKYNTEKCAIQETGGEPMCSRTYRFSV